MKIKINSKTAFTLIVIFFAIFLIAPIGKILFQSLLVDNNMSLENYEQVITSKELRASLINSVIISIISAAISTVIAFMLAYMIHYTHLPKSYKNFVCKIVTMPMLLPTITYGFAIIYSFGKQGLITKIFEKQLFDIYGFNGLLVGYIIYTLPISFMLINNAMGYIDKKFTIVSKLMGDKPMRNFNTTVLRPLWGTVAISLIQSFFLAFTDFGIPASVGGKFQVISSVLYKYMIGSIPDFGKGAVVALIMLMPSIISIILLRVLDKYNIRYDKISTISLEKSMAKDGIFAILSSITTACIVLMFAVIFIMPFIKDWPYNINFTMEHIQAVFRDESMLYICKNSLIIALLTATLGSIVAYLSAILTERSKIDGRFKQVIETIALITNTIPGMVIGLAYLLMFSGTSLQGTLLIVVICNTIHFFSTPYLMFKTTLSKLNYSWETTALLLGDSSLKTIIRIITPNVFSTLIEAFNYYFINSIVTISAVVFIVGTKSMVITTKIKELQYFNKYNEVFVLSIMILAINLGAKYLLNLITKLYTAKNNKPIQIKKVSEKLA